jgi:FAD/FMN-containing dehydrogenase
VRSFAERKAQLAADLRAGQGGHVALGKSTSNLFRDRQPSTARRLDVSRFNHVLAVDEKQGWVDAEGMTPYDALAEATLRHQAMPCVVPQLKSITIGGAVAGVAIESSSFRYGLAHETMLELEVLLGDGSVVVCTPDNEHKDLFYGFPNSYGTLGYALRVKTQTVRTRRYVELKHSRFDDSQAYFSELARRCDDAAIDFLDGAVFGQRDLVLTTGRFVDQAPYTSDYTFEHIFYRSLRERDTDYLTAADYLWRWDTDWFWCSKNLGAQNPVLRRLLGRDRLNSRFYTKVMRWNSRWGLMRGFEQLSGYKHRESVIQDVDIPIEHAAEFLEFFHERIGILPIWICPIRTRGCWSIYPMDASRIYVNFGFWDVVRRREPHEAGYFNRLIEERVRALGGIKSLYSDSYYDEEQFWTTYNRAAYRALKDRYDPKGAFRDLYAKCVLRH